jgi:hypothetical protein
VKTYLKQRQKVKTYFLPGYLGFETRQSLASNRVNPTQNQLIREVSLFFPLKKGQALPVFFC